MISFTYELHISLKIRKEKVKPQTTAVTGQSRKFSI